MTIQPIKKSKTILLVDDEDLILNVGKACLNCLGYKAIVANSGEMAVDIVSKYKGDIDLIILDFMLPGINGSMAYYIIHNSYPKWKS